MGKPFSPGLKTLRHQILPYRDRSQARETFKRLKEEKGSYLGFLGPLQFVSTVNGCIFSCPGLGASEATDTNTGFLRLAGVPRPFMWCLGFCLLNSFPILLKGSPARRGWWGSNCWRQSELQERTNHLPSPHECVKTLEGPPPQIFKEGLLLKKKKPRDKMEQSSCDLGKSTLRTTLFTGADLHLWLLSRALHSATE